MLVFLKTFALFYLLESVCVGIICGLWPFVERKIPKVSRGRMLVFSLVFAVGVAFVASFGIFLATALGYLRMLTSGFAFLMNGPFELLIILTGILGMLLSILSSIFLLREPRLPELALDAEVQRIGDVQVRVSDSAPMAALIGTKKPVIVLSRQIWQDKDSLSLALLHELAHLRLKHNLLKFLARTILRLNFVFPWLHWAVNRLEVLCEIECDQRVVELVGVKRYAEFLLSLPMKNYAYATGVTTALRERICELWRPSKGSLFFGLVPLILASIVPILLLIPIGSRCLFVCFLGY